MAAFHANSGSVAESATLSLHVSAFAHHFALHRFIPDFLHVSSSQTTADGSLEQVEAEER